MTPTNTSTRIIVHQELPLPSLVLLALLSSLSVFTLVFEDELELLLLLPPLLPFTNGSRAAGV
ncbi:MAG: hypothetical protein Q8N08_06260 [Methanobacteriaceae archaeon]|nr:hypothetical protein [Methanobacteriaceae archaeon]